MTERVLTDALLKPVLGRLVKRAVTSMNEYQSKKSLLPRLTSGNVVTKEDKEALSSALGGTTGLVPRKHGSSLGSSCGSSGTELLPPPTPRDIGSPSLSRIGNNPTKTLPYYPLMPIKSLRAEWQNTWSQVSQNEGDQYSVYPAVMSIIMG